MNVKEDRRRLRFTLDAWPGFPPADPYRFSSRSGPLFDGEILKPLEVLPCSRTIEGQSTFRGETVGAVPPIFRGQA